MHLSPSGAPYSSNTSTGDVVWTLPEGATLLQHQMSVFNIWRTPPKKKVVAQTLIKNRWSIIPVHTYTHSNFPHLRRTTAIIVTIQKNWTSALIYTSQRSKPTILILIYEPKSPLLRNMKKVTSVLPLGSHIYVRKSLTAAYTTRTAQGKFHVTSRGFHDIHLRHPTQVFESTILHLLPLVWLSCKN